MSVMDKAKILFVDDDQRMCRLVKRYIENNGYEMLSAHNAEDAHALLQDDNIVLILLDIMMPDKDGLVLAQEIRNLSNIPIIFLTAKAELDDKVNGLSIGADDYITKPFEEKELIARIQTVLRRTNAAEAQHENKTQAIFSGWCLNLLNQTLSSPEGKDVELTSTEYHLLSKLVSRSNTTIKREEILNILSGREWSPLDRSADMAISKLRKKIEKNPRKPELIKTIRNKGYRLTSAVDFA
ncbi:MAG: response regulator transcription factor [Candidatus Heimdallarchaeota archaeon]|nr:response regulator transcription factor [Candidatus Heimdallarchaeota archaeon]